MGTLPKSHSFERHHKDSPIPVSPSKTFPAGDASLQLYMPKRICTCGFFHALAHALGLPGCFSKAGGEVASDGAWAIAAHGGAGAISDTASILARYGNAYSPISSPGLFAPAYDCPFPSSSRVQAPGILGSVCRRARNAKIRCFCHGCCPGGLHNSIESLKVVF